MQIKDLTPNLVLLNGRIYTLDQEQHVVQAAAVKDGSFLAIGNTAEIETLIGPGTRRIDLGGRAVIPGIFDAHVHMLEVGTKLSQLRLDECSSPEEMAELVAQRARDTPPGTWIVGQGWNEATLGRLPTRADIDPATSQHPVVLMRFFNTDLVNSYALRLAGIHRRTPDPPMGKIEHDAGGEPNGLLRAGAKALVRCHIPKPTLEQLKQAVQLGCRELHRHGITSIVDPGLRPPEICAYQSLYREGDLTMRANLMPSWHGFWDDEAETQLDARARELGVCSGLGDPWLRLGALKMAVDGGTTPHTAYMYEPFEGEDRVSVFNRLDVNSLAHHFRTAQELGWDVGIHCCGDRAQDDATEAWAAIASELPRPDARHSIIHAYFPTPRALDRMARHHLAAVIQPTFIYWEGELLFRDVGARRAANYKPARTYLEHGVPLIASSDVPSTVSPNPFVALYALVTRNNRFGQAIAPDQAISRQDALRAYTQGGTWLTREERLKGTIAVGKVADMAVLDRDYFAVNAEEIKDIGVEMTIVGGRVVWQRE